MDVLQIITSASDLVTSREQTRAGFITFALEKNKKAKKPVLIEFSLFYEGDSVLIVERDSGDLFDLTDSYSQVKGLSSFILTGLMKAHDEKKYLVTTGYNRNMIRFARGSAGGEEPVDPGIII